VPPQLRPAAHANEACCAAACPRSWRWLSSCNATAHDLQGDDCHVDPEVAAGPDELNEKALALKRLDATVASYSLVRPNAPDSHLDLLVHWLLRWSSAHQAVEVSSTWQHAACGGHQHIKLSRCRAHGSMLRAVAICQAAEVPSARRPTFPVTAPSQRFAHTHGCPVVAQEAGIIIHSIFIGLSYGAETDYDTIRALTIALGFHQVRAMYIRFAVPLSCLRFVSCSCAFTAAAIVHLQSSSTCAAVLLVHLPAAVAVLVACSCSSLH
jgi:hypothetical protein